MDAQVERLHEASMRILNEIGMEFQSERICGILKENGVRVENGRAYFTEEQITGYLQSTPKEFTIKARNSKYDALITSSNINFAAGYGSARISDPYGNCRLAQLSDYVKFAKMVHMSDDFKINGGILAQPNEIEADVTAQVMVYAAMRLSDKCLFGAVGTEKTVKDIVNMASIAFGEDLKKNYRIISLISPISPLKVDANMLDTLYVLALNNQPVIIASGPMAGATGPITTAGNVAMANAEILGVLAVTQIINPGNPVVYGSAATISDMLTMRVSIGSPGFTKQAKYSARLAEKYGLPKRTGGPLTDALALTAQAGVESAMSLFETFQENANFVMHGAGIMESFNAMSYEKFVLDLETISRMKYYFEDLDVSEEAFAFDAIKDAVNGKSFIQSKHTAKRIRKVPWLASVSKNRNLKPGETQPEAFFGQLQQQVEKMLSEYETPEFENLGELDRYMRSIGVGEDVLAQIR